MTSDPINSRRRLGVLVSGRGSNLQALIDAIAAGTLDAEIAVVISNREDAGALDLARRAGVEAMVISHQGWPARDAYDRVLAEALQARHVGLVCLAGFMRLVGPPLLAAFPSAILNIHPSLLPAFPGIDPQGRAIEHGAKVSGVTVHFVTAELDAGPIIVQRCVPVLDGDTTETLAARILEEEHRAYPEAVRLVLDGGWALDGRRFLRSRSAASG